METKLFNIAYLCYSLSTLLYLLYLLSKKEIYSRMAFGLLSLALLVHGGSLALRIGSMRGEFIWTNWYESFSFFGAIIAVLYFMVGSRKNIPILGAFVMPVSWALLTGAFISNKTLETKVPRPHGYWMAIHVPVMFTAYAILGIAFAVGIAYLLEERQLKSKRPSDLSYRLPSLEELDTLIYRLIAVAIVPLTLGIAFGCAWAYSAWGHYWSWDPKETWALITWLIYIVYLGLRVIAGWRGRKTAYLSLAGFAAVLFTYAGVNYLSPLHRFLSGQGG